MRQASALYRLLGDEARLRLLRVLSRERLNVTELTGILGLAQSGVSRHLGLLKDAGLVVEEKDAGYTYYRLAPSLQDDRPAFAVAGARSSSSSKPARTRSVRADEARLQEVLRLRKENFDTHGGADTRDARQLVPGRSWAAWSRALGLLLPPLEVADLGCGEGYLTIEAARWAARVIAVDRSEAVLERAQGAGAPAPRRQRRLEARRARQAADQGSGGRRRAALAGAPPRERSGARRRGSGADHEAGRARARSSTCGSTQRNGSAPSSATAVSASATTSCRRC